MKRKVGEDYETKLDNDKEEKKMKSLSPKQKPITLFQKTNHKSNIFTQDVIKDGDVNVNMYQYIMRKMFVYQKWFNQKNLIKEKLDHLKEKILKVPDWSKSEKDYLMNSESVKEIQLKIRDLYQGILYQHFVMKDTLNTNLVGPSECSECQKIREWQNEKFSGTRFETFFGKRINMNILAQALHFESFEFFREKQKFTFADIQNIVQQYQLNSLIGQDKLLCDENQIPVAYEKRTIIFPQMKSFHFRHVGQLNVLDETFDRHVVLVDFDEEHKNVPVLGAYYLMHLANNPNKKNEEFYFCKLTKDDIIKFC